MVVGLSVIALTGCFKPAVEDVQGEASPTVEATSTLSEETLQEISVLGIEASISAKLVAANIELVTKGIKLDGSPTNLTELVYLIHESGQKLSKKYADIINSLPDGELKEAIREAMFADEHFHRTASSIVTSKPGQWATDFQDALRRREEASARLSAEVKLARG